MQAALSILPDVFLLLEQPGIQITIVVFLLIFIAALTVILIKYFSFYRFLLKKREAKRVHQKIAQLSEEEVSRYEKREQELQYRLPPNSLSGNKEAADERGLLQNVNSVEELRVFPVKASASTEEYISPALARLILYFVGSAIFWLLLGTTAGLYAGIKFVAPDLDHQSWLSFGRLRPSHTNMVFWGWASTAMIGLAYYVLPKVSNRENFNIRLGYASLIFINLGNLGGTLSILAGVNNGGGEYREYIWPFMGLFALGVTLSVYNYFLPVVERTLKEIYISSWYIVSAGVFIVIILLVGYLPFWQNGISEAIIQGYYMHQAIGMWFMFTTLGLMYYFLPQQLNKPIYSYSLGVLGFWSHIFFYTLIGTHHYIFSAIPWRLQTTAIIASAGMVIPVVAGTANFLLTFRDSWYKLKYSYTLPFYLMGIVFYFTGSLQGTAQAFRYSNLLWHFTDFTVAHSHMTMYGIITFMLWGFCYTMLPRLTGKEPPKILVGLHFWFALIGLLFYAIALMIGGTETGRMWMAKKPFIQGVVNMAPFWLWRAIGGTMMWISHLLFAYNFYRMVKKREEVKIPRTPAEILAVKKQLASNDLNP